VQSIGAQSIRRTGATDRPVRKLGMVVDEGGEPKFKAHDTEPPAAPPERTETEFQIADDEETDYESPAFLRYQAK